MIRIIYSVTFKTSKCLVYPYEYMNGWTKFYEKKLPSKEAFYSRLNNSHISDKEYEYAICMGKAGCKASVNHTFIYLDLTICVRGLDAKSK